MSFVITGNPGVGKHTIAKDVSKVIDFNIIDINKIVINNRWYIKNKTDKTYDVDTILLKKKVMELIDNRSIIVGHLAPYVLNRKQIKMAFILRKNPYELISVYKKRRYNKKKMNDNIICEILGSITYDAIINFGINKIYQIDTTSKPIKYIINKIVKRLNNELISDNIDWLSLILQNNDFKKFFQCGTKNV